MKNYQINGKVYRIDDAVYNYLMDALCDVNAFKNKAERLKQDNEHLMEQISAKEKLSTCYDVELYYAEPLLRIATALEAIAELAKPILVSKEMTND